MNVICTMTDVVESNSLLDEMQRIVSGGLLRTFASTQTQQVFFQSNNVTELSPCLFSVDETGYDSGNRLLGLCISFGMFFSLIFYLSCNRAVGRGAVAMEPAVPAICTEFRAISTCFESDSDSDRD